MNPTEALSNYGTKSDEFKIFGVFFVTVTIANVGYVWSFIRFHHAMPKEPELLLQICSETENDGIAPFLHIILKPLFDWVGPLMLILCNFFCIRVINRCWFLVIPKPKQCSIGILHFFFFFFYLWHYQCVVFLQAPLSGSNSVTPCSLWCNSSPVTLTVSVATKAFTPGMVSIHQIIVLSV